MGTDGQRAMEKGMLPRTNATPDGRRIVSMVEHKGRLVLATERSVYELRDGEWWPLKFVIEAIVAPASPPDRETR